MPIIEPAPWRHQFFEGIPCPDHVVIPTDDPEAWTLNPEHRWVFDKLAVALSQGLEAGPHGLMPPSFPVFSKPIINFKGMGLGTRVYRSEREYLDDYRPGHLWMPLLDGEHVSTDVAVEAGRAVWIRHTTGIKAREGMFACWVIHGAPNPSLEDRLIPWIARNLRGYTGLINLETIGGTIIEAHLRFSDQWPDLYGRGWIEALIGLYADRHWRFTENVRSDAFSIPLFGPVRAGYRHPPQPLLDEILGLPGVSSVQVTFHEARAPALHAMPPGGFRLAIVNTTVLEAGERAIEKLRRFFLGDEPLANVPLDPSELRKLRARPALRLAIV